MYRLCYNINVKKLKDRSKELRIQLNNIKQNQIIILDSEYDSRTLIQLAFLVLQRVDRDVFEVIESFNTYLNKDEPVSAFFRHYTNISDTFLCDNGVNPTVAKALVQEALLGVDTTDTLLVGHDIKNDLLVLKENGFDFTLFENQYCTYQAAKRLLQRNNNLGLKDIAANGCYYCFNEHNAYADVWATLAAFSWLNKIEKEEKSKC